MPALGIDTSNYATSLAAFSRENGVIFHRKRLLPVKEGALGLRQSEALFEHIKALPDMLGELKTLPGLSECEAVGVSVRPRDAEGSYMPCFLAGKNAAAALAAGLNVPLLEFSHQAGHLAAALYATPLFKEGRRRFYAFHVSGGTTEALLADFSNPNYRTELLAASLDVHAGQIIDRVGLGLGLAFPAGEALSKLAEESGSGDCLRPSLKGDDCCLSGIENKCADLLKTGAPAADIARYCLLSIGYALLEMTRRISEKGERLPFVFAGGVMQSGIIRDILKDAAEEAYFAEPAWLSADNAVGVAILASGALL
ncbi:MAG: peptidase M22 [Oscillospiraceae bacterium]|nr:peptidase M22 [Oscillospiraceae bacterium]